MFSNGLLMHLRTTTFASHPARGTTQAKTARATVCHVPVVRATGTSSRACTPLSRLSRIANQDLEHSLLYWRGPGRLRQAQTGRPQLQPLRLPPPLPPHAMLTGGGLGCLLLVMVTMHLAFDAPAIVAVGVGELTGLARQVNTQPVLRAISISRKPRQSGAQIMGQSAYLSRLAPGSNTR